MTSIENRSNIDSTKKDFILMEPFSDYLRVHKYT